MAASHLAPLRVASLAVCKERETSESRFTQPSRLTVLSCAARRSEMAYELKFIQVISLGNNLLLK